MAYLEITLSTVSDGMDTVITALTAGGMAGADAAVRAIRSLAMAELLCVAAGIAVVLCLPEIHNKGETA